MQKLLKMLGFDNKTFVRFFIIVANSQLIYAFIALRSVLYDPFIEVMGVTNTEFGILMGFIGFISTFGGAAIGWLQDRFSERDILAVNTFIYGGLGLALSLVPAVPFPVKCLCFISFGFNADAMYWATILKSVRQIAKEDRQGTAFGVMEFFRGLWELVSNGIGVAIFTVLGSTLFGMRMAMTAACAIMFISGISVMLFIPKNKELASKGAAEKTRFAFKGFIVYLKNPWVWMTGLSASCVYAMFIGVNTYFVPYLKNVYLLPVSLVGVFGLVNGSITRFVAGPVSGMFADKKFKSSAHLMRLCYGSLAVLLLAILLLPTGKTLVYPAMIILLLVAVFCFLIRGIYYAPIGEMGIARENGAAAMAVASFIGYSPSFWGYPLYGSLIDIFGHEQAYRYIFILLIVLSVAGFILTYFLGKHIIRRKTQMAETAAS
ncbi:MAG: MFS transporter [Treponemataceae bacterium]|jgi:predicted MFS family arabinose efflux permease|nr:MAG: MFS transporter [Treponemataceae bacterium]